MKRELRGEERGELVAFRVAVDKWEYFLETMLFDFAMLPPSEAKVASLYEKDKELFLEVRIAVVKACTYLVDEKLEDLRDVGGMGAVRHVCPLAWLYQGAAEKEEFSRSMSVFVAKPHVS